MYCAYWRFYTHRIHGDWYIYLHLADFYGKCWQIYHGICFEFEDRGGRWSYPLFSDRKSEPRRSFCESMVSIRTSIASSNPCPNDRCKAKGTGCWSWCWLTYVGLHHTAAIWIRSIYDFMKFSKEKKYGYFFNLWGPALVFDWNSRNPMIFHCAVCPWCLWSTWILRAWNGTIPPFLVVNKKGL